MKTENIIDILSKIEEEQSLLFSIDVLNLSPRFHRTLLRNHTNTIGDLVRNWRAIPEFTNMGIKGIQEITDKLNLWYQKKGHLLFLPDVPEVPPNEKPSVEELSLTRDNTLLNSPISTLNLSIRTYNALRRHDIETVRQVLTEWQNISFIKNVGPATLEEIQKAIASLQNQISIQKDTSHGNLPNNEILVKEQVRVLALPRSAETLLKNNNIQTIDQITSGKMLEISSAEDTNPHTIRQIFTAVVDWLNADENRKNAYIEFMQGKGLIAKPDQISFDDYFNNLFSLLNSRYYPMMEFRHGLRTGKKVTLEETAKQFGVTRERIRQIESLAIDQVKIQLSKTGSPWLFQKIREKIEARGGFISQSRLTDELRHEFKNTIYSIEGILEFFNKVFDGELSTDHDDVKIVYVLTLSGWSTSSYDKDQILQTANKTLEILSTAELPIQWADLFSVLVREDGLLTLDEHLAHAISLCLIDTQKIQRQMDGSWFKFEKGTRYNRIIYIMRQIGQPAHFSEISDMYDEIYSDQPLSEHGVHTVLSGRNEFVRVGRGKYGLPEWGLHDDGNVSNAVLRILVNHKHPMFLADITDEVLKTWDVQSSAVISAIDSDARFSKTDDGKIWLTEAGLTLKKKVKRDDDARWDRLLIVLRELGKPLSVDLIVDAHNISYPERPLTVAAVKSMMYRKPELFVRTGRDEFGLAEWGLQPLQDVPVNRSEEILKILRRKSPIHIKEIHNLYNEYHPENQVSLITIGIDLRNLIRNLAGTVSSPRRGIYQIIDEVEVETTPSQQDKRIEKI